MVFGGDGETWIKKWLLVLIFGSVCWWWGCDRICTGYGIIDATGIYRVDLVVVGSSMGWITPTSVGRCQALLVTVTA